ncbi:gluconate:H+ symporter [Aquirufa antheringensis]|jgi:Gnt-I system high-affinity gluconate transporter|uniref:Gluconate transporter n=1 Tax=Aquirufa antheringensis TaxID=2516559 RepID=A0A4Q9BC05_9BACT|nr:gluconate:H+ symporter [Aquirufa antheringensis]TBH72008.1 gluconate transporter [Aquirufa antheringensis]USQ04062.1 gluconate transporter [Aquirufa antheringensis]
MTLLIVIASLGLLVLLITYWKVNSFISFLLVSIFAGVCFGLPLPDIAKSIQKGLGDTLGSLVVILVLGAMLGKLVAASGAAKQISGTLIDLFGLKNITWGLMLTGFVIGIPLFYNVGFVLMIPLIFSLVQQYKIPPLMAGVPMMASLSVAHGFLPPHPSPAALVAQFHANMGETLILGIMVAIPAIILAGPIFAKTLAHLPVKPLKSFAAAEVEETNLPSKTASFIAALFPVFLLVGTTIAEVQMPDSSVVKFIADPAMVMLVAILVATYVLGIRRGKKIEEVMNVYGEAVKEVAMILLIIAGAGTLKEILLISGVSQEIASYLGGLPIHPLVLGWMMAAIIRVCLGSATIAGLTAAGMIYPLVAAGGVNANLMVLSIGAGSLMFSHVNDTGFWLFKEYFNLTVKETLRSWSLMETIVSLTGLAGVMLLDQFL